MCRCHIFSIYSRAIDGHRWIPYLVARNNAVTDCVGASSPYKYQISFFSFGAYPVLRFLGYVVILFSTSGAVFTPLHRYIIFKHCVEMPCLYILSLYNLFNNSHSNRYEMMTHWGFLTFPWWIEMLNFFSHAFGLFRNIDLGVLNAGFISLLLPAWMHGLQIFFSLCRLSLYPNK